MDSLDTLSPLFNLFRFGQSFSHPALTLPPFAYKLLVSV